MMPAALLARVPGCEDGCPPLDIRPLPGGRGCNLVLRLETQLGRFVFRQRQLPLDRPGSLASTELHCQLVAAAAGLAPRVIQAAPDGGWILMEYVEAPVWTEDQLTAVEGVVQLGEQLAKLHALQPPAVPGLDAAAVAMDYLQQLERMDGGAADRLRTQWTRVVELSEAIAAMHTGPAVLNHGDLQVGNLLGRCPIFIDWEYAQLTDPSYDLACLFCYYPGLERHRDLLLRAAGLDPERHGPVLALQKERFACLNQLWEATNAL